jgi:hypothetical protein
VHTHRIVAAVVIGLSLAGCAASEENEATASQASALSAGGLPGDECYLSCREEGGTYASCKQQCAVVPTVPVPVSTAPVATTPPSSPVYEWQVLECTAGRTSSRDPIQYGQTCKTYQQCTHFDGPCTGSPFLDPARVHTSCITAAGVTQCTTGWNQFPSIRACADGSVMQSNNFCL